MIWVAPDASLQLGLGAALGDHAIVVSGGVTVDALDHEVIVECNPSDDCQSFDVEMKSIQGVRDGNLWLLLSVPAMKHLVSALLGSFAWEGTEEDQELQIIQARLFQLLDAFSRSPSAQ